MSAAASALARQLAAAQHRDAMPRLQGARGPTRICLCLALLVCLAGGLIVAPLVQNATAAVVVETDRNSSGRAAPMPAAALRFAGAYRSGELALDEASAAEWVRVLGWLVERARAAR